MSTPFIRNVLDHAGSFYGWWYEIEVKGTSLYLELNLDYFPQSKTFAAPEMRATMKRMADSDDWNDYNSQFFKNAARGNWDDADGDMNSVDCFLQELYFGEQVFG